ncbi:hypothetical protein CLV58_1176 [Spirosoma oryzae]|uniref:Helicase n=1 Tax=Spirosoma oryzae TaxID=1469603 RepID=A0A2T0SLW4_9BACT|nr:hypothetical protein [Spirosoma oryzae]PRY34402.1 hypothetical protein CLV58_1176 [Spirosoma oryzae]
MQEIEIINQNLDKEDLLNKLSLSKIRINDYAKLIFDFPTFNYKNSEHKITIAQLTLSSLGLKNGGSFGEIEKAMKSNNFDFCPLEFAPYIRLYYQSQKPSEIIVKNQHPQDSILIFSKPLIMDDNFPKGFYIRNIENTLWLRAYICSDDYFWKPETEIILRIKPCS